MRLTSRPVLGGSLVLGCALAQQVSAQAPQPTAVMIENVRIFDGTADPLSAPSNVLVVGKVIKTISADRIADPAATSVTRIQGAGRTLMPGPRIWPWAPPRSS